MPVITTGQITITDANDGYNLSIVGGNRTFSYASSGSSPTPSGAGTFSVSLFRGGVALTPKSYSWSASGVLSTTATTATFTPALAGSYSAATTTVSVTVEYAGDTITQTIPILVSQAPSNAIINTIYTSAPAIYKDAADAATSGTYTSITIQGKRYDGSATSNFGWITVTPNTTSVESARQDTNSTAYSLNTDAASGISSYIIKLYAASTGGTAITSQTVNVSFKGATGTSPTLYELTLDPPVIVRKIDNTLNPTSLTMSGFTTVSSTKSAYSGVFKIYEDGVLKTTTASSTTYQYTPSTASIALLKVELYNSAGTVLLDTETIPVVVAGSSGMTLSIANRAHPLPAGTDGAVATYVGSGTTIQVFEGSTQLTYLTTLSTTASAFTIGTATLSVANGITVGAYSGNNTTTATVAQHSNMGNTVDAITISYPITYNRANGAQTTETITQVITKVKAGTLGIRGSRQLYSTDAAYTSTYDFDGAGAVAAGTDSYAAKATQLIATATAGSNPTTPINGDTVTFSNGSNYVYTITHNGTSWSPPGTVIDGSLLVTGSVTASKINSNGLDVRDSAGNVILSAGTSAGIASLTANANLVRGFGSWAMGGTNSVVTGGSIAENGAVLVIPSGSNSVDSSSPTLVLTTNTDYTVSFKAKSSVAGRVLYVDLFPDTLPESTATLTATWKDYQFTWNSAVSSMSSCVLRFFAGTQTGQVEIADVKLEIGSKRTPWTPNILDQPSVNNKITAATATTYIANAAIGSAQITDASITNAKIGDAAITNAKIGTAAVDTLSIAGNAVTVPVSTYTATSVTGGGVVQSASMAVSGFSVAIFCSVSYYFGIDDVPGVITTSIIRGGTTVYSHKLTMPSSLQNTASFSFSDTPGTGTFTYEVSVTWQSTSGTSPTAFARGLTLLGVKR